MISSKNIQFVIILILCILLPVFAVEPNEPNNPAGLKFKISDSPTTWTITGQSVRGPIKPEYMAMFFIKNSNHIPNQKNNGQLETSVQADLEKYISSKQKEFISTSSCYEQRLEATAETPFGYARVRLYTVSQEDAKNMALGLVELINKNIQREKENSEEYLRSREKTLLEKKQELPGKESDLKKIEEEYKNIKEETHQFSSDEEAIDIAKKSIIEMDKKFNDLDIELAGIRERIKSIKDYRNQSGLRSDIETKLASMHIDLMIELNGLEAQRKAANEIYEREKLFLNLFNKKTELLKEVDNLQQSIADNQKSIEKTKNYWNLKSITAEIFQNTVTIVPVAEVSELRNR